MPNSLHTITRLRKLPSKQWMVLARETDLGKKQGGDLEDRSTKKQRILVESVHIFRLISSISIVFDEK